MRVHLRTSDNMGHIQHTARPQSRASLTHAAQAKASDPVWSVQPLLQLQRQYGNRYVQRVLAQARKGGEKASASPDVERAIQQVRGGGQALDSSVRAQMEPVLGAGFSGVRVHTDAEAGTLSRSLNARAFTTGQDIFFPQGTYNPSSSSGRELLAHELTHVVQQSGGRVQRKLTVGQPGDCYEREADQVAEQLKRSTSLSVPRSLLQTQGQTPGIQRIPKKPKDVPFDGEIIPWSAALRSTPRKSKRRPYGNIIADLPRGHRVRVFGGRAWIFVKTHINNQDRVGYVSHELIKQVTGSTVIGITTDKGSPVSVGSGAPVPPLSYEKKWMKDQGLADKVRRVPNTATNRYNCHGFVYLGARAWLNNPSAIIYDNDYFVPKKPRVGDAVVYTKTKPKLDKERHPNFSETPPHSGLVTRGSPGNPTEVTSKWGSWHIYKHMPGDVWSGYGSPTFLRSKRKGGHTVKIETI
jgi:hypothetical protein